MVFDGEHIPIAALPGMRERTVPHLARRARRSPSPAGRSAGPARRPSCSPRCATAKQFLTYVSGAPVPARGRPGARHCPTPTSRDSGTDLRTQARPAWRRTGRPRLHRVPARGHLLPHHRRRGRSGYADGIEFCRELPHAAGVVAIPHSGLLRRQGRRPPPGALGVLQAPGGPRRGAGSLARRLVRGTGPGSVTRVRLRATALTTAALCLLAADRRSRRASTPPPGSVTRADAANRTTPASPPRSPATAARWPSPRRPRTWCRGTTTTCATCSSATPRPGTIAGQRQRPRQAGQRGQLQPLDQ